MVSPVKTAKTTARLSVANLVTNGFGELRNNTNFSKMVYGSTDLPPTAKGTFTLTTQGVPTMVTSDEFIQVDGLKRYELSAYLKQDDPAAAADPNDSFAYFGVVCYDREKREIAPWHVNERSGTRTVLYQDLNPGDTVMHVRTAANWQDPKTITDPRNNHQASIIFWDYVDTGGKKWNPGTYSRNGIYGNATGPAYTNIVGAEITLREPYAGPVRPRGTVVSNTFSGGSYLYRWSGRVTDTWTKVHGYVQGFATGSAPGDRFWQGTMFVKMMFLLDRNSTTGTLTPVNGKSRMRVASVVMVHPTVTASVATDYRGGAVHVIARQVVGDKVDIYRYDHTTQQRILLRGGLDYEVRAGGTVVIIDPEIPFNEDVTYEVVMYPDGKGSPDTKEVIKSEPLHIAAEAHYGHMGLKCAPVYLCDPLIPAYGDWFGLLSIDPLSYPPRSALFDVLGRHAPVAVSQARSEARTVIHLYTETLQDRHELLRMLASGRILLYRNPDPRYPEHLWYVSVQNVTETRIIPDHRDPRRRFSLEVAVVQRPVGYLALIKASRTYDTYRKYEPDGVTAITPPEYSGSLTDYGDYLDVQLGGMPGALRPMATVNPSPAPPVLDPDATLDEITSIWVSAKDSPVGPDFLAGDGSTPQEDLDRLAGTPAPAPREPTEEELQAAARAIRGRYPTISAAETSWSLQ